MSGKFIVKVLCSACILQILLTVYFILKIYVSTSVIRPDQVVPIHNIGAEYGENHDEFKMSYLMQEGDYFDKDLQMATARGGGSLRGVLSKLEAVKKVEIIGKAAISIFLWEHILEGTKEVNEKNPSIYTGNLAFPEAIFLYNEGPGLEPNQIDLKTENIILIVNGRTDDKVDESRKWLDYLHTHRTDFKILVVLLGNEQCGNSWLQTYMNPKGKVRGVFVVYDDPVVDGSTYFQWPLGVATYRHFPVLSDTQILASQPRKYICNLQATNHANGSRIELFETLKSHHQNCFVKERKLWENSETESSINEYISILSSSDLTLCPGGFNVETYRVYEAIAAGSVPVIQDVPAKGNCDSTSGWRLLKQFNPPVIWIRNWHRDLKILIKSEKKMSDSQKILRRKRLLNWYEWFKLRLKDRFISVVESKLLKPD